MVHVWYRDQRKLFVERKLFAYDAAPRVDYDPEEMLAHLQTLVSENS